MEVSNKQQTAPLRRRIGGQSPNRETALHTAGRKWRRNIKGQRDGSSRGRGEKLRDRSTRSHVLLTWCVRLGELCYIVSRAPPVWASVCPRQSFYQALSLSQSFLPSSLPSAPQRATSSTLLHVPGNTDVTLQSGFLLQQEADRAVCMQTNYSVNYWMNMIHTCSIADCEVGWPLEKPNTITFLF